MPLLRDQSPSARIYPFVQSFSPRQKPTRTFFNRLRYQCCSQQDPCAVVCSTPLTEITVGSSHGTSWNKPLFHRVELRLGGNSTNMNLDQIHTDTHEHAPSTHLQHTQTHTNTQLQHTDTRTCTFERQTRRCTSRTHVITDTQHARDITAHAQHNTYPPIALLPPPFSRIQNPSNMSQKHGARFWVLSVCSPC